MPSKFVVGLRACCVAVVLALSTGEAAETKSRSLVGATREQVLAQLGEPRSSIAAGAREVLLFDRDRVILRNNIVVEVEPLPTDAPRRAVAPSEESSPAEPAPATTEENQPSEQAPAAEKAPARTGSQPRTAEPIASPAPTPSREDAPLEIKSVRPAGASGPRPTKSEPPAAPVHDTAAATRAPQKAVAPVTPTVAPSTAPVAAAEKAADAAVTAAAPPVIAPDAAAAESASEKKEGAETPAAATAPKRASAGAPKHLESTDDGPIGGGVLDESVFTGRSYLIAFVIVVGGIGYLLWRSRQRRLELAATAVSRTPFAAPATVAAGARFTPELLAKLEWKRFEDLVAAYYGKTGVVAVRTKTGPASPVHIKISWKGESRPFAFVQCLAHPTGLIDAKPIQELVEALMAEDIRRGYVVTTGKFNVPARDFAEEKHITLLSGDILVEKINALPDGARNELMQEIASGDYTTPSCPKCEAKMARSPDDPNLWRCSTHPEVTLPAWK